MVAGAMHANEIRRETPPILNDFLAALSIGGLIQARVIDKHQFHRSGVRLIGRVAGTD